MTIPDSLVSSALGLGGALLGAGIAWGALHQAVKHLREAVAQFGAIPAEVAKQGVRIEDHQRADDLAHARFDRELAELRAQRST